MFKMTAAVIYARYSDSKQKEESIEAQLKICHAYAAQKGYTVINEYIDRAFSARTDDRPQFQQMIRASRKKGFQRVIVYRLDRFSRNQLDLALYKETLSKNDVKLESATENIPDNSTGILLEAVIGGVNAWYSAELAEKVKRNMKLNAEKCLSNGGYPPLGYKVVNRKYVIDENTAPIAQEIFTKYANGVTIKEICDSLNERNLKTTRGVAFNKNSLHTMLSNKKYLGIYIYGDIEVPGGIPQLIDEDLFNKVAQRLKLNKSAPGRFRAKAEYLLTTKLYCGYCKTMMIGHSSNQMSKKGVIFNYYKCKNSGGKKPCKKKMVHKDYIEDTVIKVCISLLTPANIRRIAKEVVKIAESYDDKSELVRLKKQIQELQKAKENQMASLRECNDSIIRQMIFEDLGKIGAEIQGLEKQLDIEEARRQNISENEKKKFKEKTMTKEFDKTEEYNKILSGLMHNVIKYCSANGIPVFISACIKNDKDGSLYKSDMVSAASADIKLKDDKLVKFVNVLNGFDTVPKHDDIEMNFDF